MKACRGGAPTLLATGNTICVFLKLVGCNLLNVVPAWRLWLAGGRKITGGRKMSIGACCPHPLQGPSVCGQPVNKLNFPFCMGCFVAPPLPQYKVEVLGPQNNFKKKRGCWQNTPQLCIGREGEDKTLAGKRKAKFVDRWIYFRTRVMYVGLSKKFYIRACVGTVSSSSVVWRSLFYCKMQNAQCHFET